MKITITKIKLILLNTATKQSKKLFSSSIYSLYGDIYLNNVIPTFDNDVLFQQTKKLSEDEEYIVYNLDMYYSKRLDFDSKY
ncbi:MAG: hypothetical protein ACTTJH_03445 [Bacteroidales bacterium]